MKVALAQINTTVADFEGNIEKVKASISSAKTQRAQCIIFPELTLTGYPPRDLVEDPDFIKRNLDALKQVARLSREMDIIVGYVEKNPQSRGKRFLNALAYCTQGKIQKKYFKQLLPNYDVFDESRYFESGKEDGIVSSRLFKTRLGVSICEDAWNDSQFWEYPLYAHDPLKIQFRNKAEVFINISASPFYVGKQKLKQKMFSKIARQYHRPVFYTNLVGANDELVFDGRSFVMNAQGQVIAQAKAFEEDLLIVDTALVQSSRYMIHGQKMVKDNELGDTYSALVLGLRDYVKKCGFHKVVVGLSGGIDSTLVAILAVEALGAENVMGVLMPSLYSSEGSVKDAQMLARTLNISCHTYSITHIYHAYRSLFGRDPEKVPDLADENIQARIRGNILMTLSNRSGAMVLTTGNKSEMAMGYCTLYGDMSGGLAVIADLLKTKVYELCRYIQKTKSIIPPDVLTKAPSAELRPHQKDEDSLPPYEILDEILKAIIEESKTEKQVVKMGFDPGTVQRVIRSLHLNEYKRRQAAPVLKITPRAFGVGRRYPLARKV